MSSTDSKIDSQELEELYGTDDIAQVADIVESTDWLANVDLVDVWPEDE